MRDLFGKDQKKKFRLFRKQTQGTGQYSKHNKHSQRTYGLWQMKEQADPAAKRSKLEKHGSGIDRLLNVKSTLGTGAENIYV